MRHVVAVLAGLLSAGMLASPLYAQGGPAQGAAPGIQGNGSAQSEGGSPSTHPFLAPQPHPGAGEERRETEAAPPHQGGGCRYRERKLELIV